jgi:ornithine cyclodeaminase/alanine dehydrogenase-like protein (mu-crystallin family)
VRQAVEARPVLLLSREDVEALLDLDALIDALADAMANLSAGRASVPNRVAAFVPERDGLLAAMPAYDPANAALTTKLVSLFPRNAGTALPTHQAVIVAFDPVLGEPVALLDGTYITAMRTAAGSALSARLLARPDASVLAIIGAGVQARSHAQALPLVREFTEIRVWSRNPSRTRVLVDDLAAEGLPVVAAESNEQAIAGAHVVCAATHAVEPVICRDWLSPGTHVASVGYNPPGREVDDATVADAYVVVESRAAALAPAPSGSTDLTEPISKGIIAADHVKAEIGELILGTQPGRSSDTEITLYKSVGVAVQDAAAAAQVLAAARSAGVGREVAIS